MENLSIITVIGVETINAKDGRVFYKVHTKEEIPASKNLRGAKVKDYFISFNPEVDVGDEIELIFGCGYDARAYLKEIKKV